MVTAEQMETEIVVCDSRLYTLSQHSSYVFSHNKKEGKKKIRVRSSRVKSGHWDSATGRQK